MKKKAWKRCCAAILSMAMVLTSANFTWAAGTETTVTEGQIVAANYSELSSEEKAILQNSSISGNTITYVAPTADDGLVTIDSENKTITAKAYTDSYGNVWNPSKASVKVDGLVVETLELEAKKAVGFSTTEHNYSVDVSYELYAEVDSAVQERLMNTPYYLVSGYNALEAANSARSDLASYAEVLPNLVQFAEGFDVTVGSYNVQVKLESDATIEAITKLNEQLTVNGGVFDLQKKISEYRGRDCTAQEYLLSEDGEEFRDVAIQTVKYLTAIRDDSNLTGTYITMLETNGMTTEATMLKSVNKMTKNLVKDLADAAAENNWLAIEVNKVTPLLAYTTDENLEILIDDASKYVEIHDGEVVTSLKVAETTIGSNVNRCDVTIVVSADVYEENATEVTPKTAESYVLTLNQDMSAEDVEKAIVAAGVESNALSVWEEAYQVGEEFYVRTVTELPEKLTESITYEIKYTPKKYSVVYKDATGAEEKKETVSYGYWLTFEAYENDQSQRYDYQVGNSGYIYEQGDSVRITGDTTLQRRLGKAKTASRILDVVAANYSDVLTKDAVAILNNTAVKSDSIEYRIPGDDDGLVSLELEGTQYKVTALEYESGIDGMNWIPVDCVVDGSTYTFSGGVAYVPSTASAVKVNYQLKITKTSNEKGSEITETDILYWLNLPYDLVADAKAQKGFMEKLAAQENNLAMGKDVNTALTLLQQTYSDTGNTEAYNAVVVLRDNCFDDSKNLIVYNCLQAYKTDGLYSFYKEDVGYKVIDGQLGYLTENLGAIIETKELEELLAENEQFAKYGAKLDTLMKSLNDLKAALADVAPSEMINLNDSGAAELINSLPDKTVASISESNGLYAEAPVNKAAEGKATVTLKAEVYGSDGVLDNTYTSDAVVVTMAGVTESEAASLSAAQTSVTAKVRDAINTSYYTNTVVFELPTVGTAISSNTVITAKWVANTYEVCVSEDGEERKIDTIACDDLTVTLPANTTSGSRYEYTVGDTVVKVYETAKDQVIPASVFAEAVNAGKLVIERVSINEGKESIEQLFAQLNSSVDAAGMSDTEFILMEKDGQYAVVLRLSSDAASNAQQMVMDLAQTIARGPVSYVGLNGGVDAALNADTDTFWNADDVKISLQAMIDALLESDISMQRIIDLIDENGNINENVAALVEGYTVVGNSDSNRELGGLLAEMILYCGSTASSTQTIPLYITLEDFDSNASGLLNVKGKLQKAQAYIDVDTLNDTLNATVTSPEKVYEMLVTVMLLQEQTTLDDISDVELKELIDYAMEQVNATIAKESVTTTTLQNTVDKAGVDYDLTAQNENITKALKAVRHLLDNVKISNETSSGDTYSATMAYDITQLLAQMEVSDTYTSLLKETELSIPFSLKLTNIEDSDYKALILDNSKSGLDKFNYTSDVADIAAAGENAVVILLADIEGNVTVNNGVILNLNGKSIRGSLINTSAQNTQVVDTVFGTVGTVDAVEGNFVIAGGSYGTLDTDKLAEGYSLNGSKVESDIYTISKDVNDIVVAIDAGFAEKATDVDLKYLAADIASKLAFNFYTSASLAIDGTEIYAVNIPDGLSYLEKTKSDAVNEIIDLVSCSGVETIANKLLEDLTDFAAIADAIDSDSVIAKYEITTEAWKASCNVIGAGVASYITAGVIPNADKTTTSTLKITVDGTAEEKEELAELFDELDSVVTINELKLTLNDISYTDGSLTVDGQGDIDIAVDLSENSDYLTVMGVILAYGDQDNAELKAALETWLSTGKVADLKDAIESMPSKDIISALKAAKGHTFDEMTEALGLTSVPSTSGYLEGVYHDYLNLAYTLIGRLGLEGGNGTLAGIEEDGVYKVSKENWKKMNIALEVKIFPEEDVLLPPEIEVSVTNISGLVYSSKVDGNYIFLDVDTYGITKAQFDQIVDFTAETADTIEWSFTSGITDDGKVATGATVDVVAENAAGTDKETYTVIIMGDVDKDGISLSFDAQLIADNFLWDKKLDTVQLLAADMDQAENGPAYDAQKIMDKFFEISYKPVF